MPNWAWDTITGGYDPWVWLTLRSYLRWDPDLQHYRTDVVWPSHATLAKKAGISVNTVKKSLNNLAANGHIEIIPQTDRGSSNRYRFTDLERPKELDAFQAKGFTEWIETYPYSDQLTDKEIERTRSAYRKALQSAAWWQILGFMEHCAEEWEDPDYIPRPWNFLSAQDWADVAQTFTPPLQIVETEAVSHPAADRLSARAALHRYQKNLGSTGTDPAF